MKKILGWLGVTVALLSTQVAKGEAFTNLDRFGSVPKAEAAGLVTGNFVSVWVYQYTTNNGPVDVKEHFVASVTFTSKAALEDYVRMKINFVAQGALTNTLVNKGGEFLYYAQYAKFNLELGGVVEYFVFQSTFYLNKSADGTYSLPDFSNARATLPPTLLVQVPGMLWARMEVFRKGGSSTSPIDYEDPRIQTGSSGFYIDVDSDHPYIVAKTGYATDTNQFVLKVTMVVIEDGKTVFKVFIDGHLVTETPISVTNFTLSGGTVSFDIQGGDTGRIYAIERASDMCGPWVQDDENLHVVRAFGATTHYTKTLTGGDGIGFYRIHTVDLSPY
jgi:hypothetical protein